MGVALRGNLDDFGIAEVFQLIGQQRKTGILVISGNGPDVRLAFEGHGQVIPRQSAEAVALLVASEFGADAVLLGEVARYREREGSSYGSFAPASVDFEVTLYSAPGATRLWTARFEQTQPPLSSNFFVASRYPSGGTRFLTAAELARWGASLLTAELPLGR